ncbi:hypothetical protein AB3R30_26180 [Leptolyngbyaceae cyanobacterium UHCC 1019]
MLAERRQRAIVLRKAGATYEQIATVIAREFAEFRNYSRSMAFRDVRDVLQHIEDSCFEEAAIMRRLESERLDMAMFAIHERVEEGNLYAIDRWIAIIAAQCRLWGLNLPPAERPIAETTTSEIELKLITPDLFENSRN